MPKLLRLLIAALLGIAAGAWMAKPKDHGCVEGTTVIVRIPGKPEQIYMCSTPNEWKEALRDAE